MRKLLIKKLTIPLFFAILSSLLGLFLSGCAGSSQVTPRVQTSFLLDTTVSITYYENEDASMVSKAISLCGDYELIFSRKNEEAELYQVNQRAGEKVKISENLYEVLEMALQLSKETNGAFDITLGSVSDLYAFTSENPTVPSEADLQEALSHTGYEKVVLSQEAGTYYVQVQDQQLILDLGAIAKGYIADRLKAYLSARDVDSGIINLGGNILLIGEKPTKKNFLGNGFSEYSDYTVGIQYPEANSSQTIHSLKLTNVSCVTAGVYQRFFEQNGKMYHHILNPEDGKPTDNGLLSVSIEGEKSAICDALSTSCMVLGLEDGSSFLKDFYPGYTGYFITNDKKVHIVK